ncbi:MAG: aminoglycoside phosphotransferase family protein [Chloroflexota bacterium]
MTEAASTWRSTLYIALPAPFAPALLMLSTGSGWTLPSLQVARHIYLANVGEVHELFSAEYGIGSTVLRCISAVTDHEQQTKISVYALEAADPEWQMPPDSDWVNRDRLASLSLAQPDQRVLLENALAELEGEPLPALRPAWARAGWFGEACGWIEKVLAQSGDKLLSPVEQTRSWGISAILRARTTRGMVYFKVANQWKLATNEPLVMQALAGWYPQVIPRLLAAEPERRWMLMDAFGDALRENADMGVWEAAIRRYVLLQIDSVRHLDALHALGCADRRLETLPQWIDLLLADSEMLAVLEAAEAQQLIALAEPLKAFAAKLSAYKLPVTLVHGDLHPGNIAVQPEGFLFYDWTDAFIGHPLMDLLTLLNEATEMPDGAQVVARLRDAYLSQWTAYEPMERLQEAWLFAEPLAALHQVISYRNIYSILENTSKFEFTGGFIYWVRQLLKLAAAARFPVG